MYSVCFLTDTTDNASNNSPLVESLKGSIQGLELSSNIPIFWLQLFQYTKLYFCPSSFAT